MELQKHDLMLPFSQGDYHHPGDFDQIERVITPIMEQIIYDACAVLNITLKVKETV